MTSIIATCKLCGYAGRCDPETLICTDCQFCRRRDTNQLNMAKVADLAAAIHSFIESTETEHDDQARGLLYAASAIVHTRDLDKNDMLRFFHGCLYEFEQT